MRWDEAYKSTSGWLKAADLPAGKSVSVTIESVDLENVGEDQKLVVHFEGKEKALVLNKTNAAEIGASYGDDTDDWTGKELYLFVKQVSFQGQMVPAIRVGTPIPQPEEDDPIPF